MLSRYVNPSERSPRRETRKKPSFQQLPPPRNSQFLLHLKKCSFLCLFNGLIFLYLTSLWPRANADLAPCKKDVS